MAESRAMEISSLEHVQRMWENMRTGSPIYTFLLSEIQLVEATNGRILANLEVKSSHMNSKGTLHGTVSACIIDWAGGLAIASTGRDKTGLSTDIHTTFTSTAKEGDLLEIEGRVTKLGSSLGFTTIEIRKKDGGVVANGTHTKYIKT